jgi:hypothetical protein
MATKASKVLLMFWPAIMLTAWGVGVLRSECYLFAEQYACGCVPNYDCSCVNSSCSGPIRICQYNYVLLPTMSGGNKLGSDASVLACWTDCACKTVDGKPCSPRNPCRIGTCEPSANQFLKPEKGAECPGGNPR